MQCTSRQNHPSLLHHLHTRENGHNKDLSRFLPDSYRVMKLQQGVKTFSTFLLEDKKVLCEFFHNFAVTCARSIKYWNLETKVCLWQNDLPHYETIKNIKVVADRVIYLVEQKNRQKKTYQIRLLNSRTGTTIASLVTDSNKHFIVSVNKIFVLLKDRIEERNLDGRLKHKYFVDYALNSVENTLSTTNFLILIFQQKILSLQLEKNQIREINLKESDWEGYFTIHHITAYNDTILCSINSKGNNEDNACLVDLKKYSITKIKKMNENDKISALAIDENYAYFGNLQGEVTKLRLETFVRTPVYTKPLSIIENMTLNGSFLIILSSAFNANSEVTIWHKSDRIITAIPSTSNCVLMKVSLMTQTLMGIGHNKARSCVQASCICTECAKSFCYNWDYEDISNEKTEQNSAVPLIVNQI